MEDKGQGVDKGVEEAEALLAQDHYTPEELAQLLETTVEYIVESVYHGRLKAVIVDHQIAAIRRSDVLEWLASGR